MKRYALLVGIDCYLGNDGTRKFTDCGEVFLPHLNGCLHDVRMIESLLQQQYDMSPDDIIVLSSSLPELVAGGDFGSLEPSESSEPERLPTFENIKREFESMLNKAITGDFFFFHFSGHGARIPRVHASPPSHEKDPSLLTFDFCRGKRAVRGWELNKWLRGLNEQGVRVVVSLDSCYSGDAWRAGDNDTVYRTPDDWGSRSVVNLKTDRDEPSDQSEFRAGEFETSWSLNPENFTVMTACSVDQKAAERSRNNQMGGHFTQALLQYLKSSDYHVTYRMVVEHLQHVLDPQKPQIHGRDRFLFFGNSEPFSVTPLKARIQGERLQIPAGRAHGISLGSEFVPFPPKPYLTHSVTVDSVEDFTSSAGLLSKDRSLFHQHNDTIVASRWHLGEGSVLRVVLDGGFESDGAFGWSLLKALENHFASAVQVIQEGDRVNDASPKDMPVVFTLQCDNQDRIKIRGPEALIGYNDPVRPLMISASDDYEKLATAVASPLLHLCRFGKTLDLNSADSLSYKVYLLPTPSGTPESPSYSQNQGFAYIFENTDQQDLFFVILSLTPEFGIRQLLPSTDSQQRVTAGGRFQRSLRFQVPEAPAEISECLHRTSRREIIRTIVTTRDGVSWKILELPSIWEANLDKVTQSSEHRVGILDKCVPGQWSVFDNRIMLDGS